MKTKILGSLPLLLITLPAFGLNSYFCSSGGQYINVGASADQVKTACGAPTQVIPYKPGSTANQQNADQIWTYNVTTNPLTSSSSTYYQTGGSPFHNGINGAVGYGMMNANVMPNTTFTVTVHQGVISAVSTSKAACGNWEPYVGVPAQAVLDHCGQPLSAQTATATTLNPYKNKIETWIYQNPYGASLKLQLVNGQVTSMDLVSNQS